MQFSVSFGTFAIMIRYENSWKIIFLLTNLEN
jgi:hypothetical protein